MKFLANSYLYIIQNIKMQITFAIELDPFGQVLDKALEGER